MPAEDGVVTISVIARMAQLKTDLKEAQAAVKAAATNMAQAMQEFGASAKLGNEKATAALAEYRAALQQAEATLAQAQAAIGRNSDAWARETAAANKAAEAETNAARACENAALKASILARAAQEAEKAQFLESLAADKSAVAHRHQISEMAAASAAIRTFDGSTQGSIRAVERFIGTTLGLGPVLKAAFPVIGAIALLGFLYEMEEKLEAFIKKLDEMAEHAHEAFAAMHTDAELANDSMQLSNDELENTIAKLQGNPQNNLKIALDEANISADKLAKSLNADLHAMRQLLAENQIGTKQFLISGVLGTFRGARQIAKTSDVDGTILAFEKQLAQLGTQLEQDTHRNDPLAIARDNKDITDKLNAAANKMASINVEKSQQNFTGSQDQSVVLEHAAGAEAAFRDRLVTQATDKQHGELAAKEKEVQAAKTLQEQKDAASRKASAAAKAAASEQKRIDTELFRDSEEFVEQQKDLGKMSAVTELDFWTGKQNALKKGAADYHDLYRDIQKKIDADQKQIRLATDAGKNRDIEETTKGLRTTPFTTEAATKGFGQGTGKLSLESKDISNSTAQTHIEEVIRLSDEAAKKGDEAEKKSLETVRQTVEEEDRLAEQAYQADVERIDDLSTLNEISGKKKIAMLRAAEEASYQPRRERLQGLASFDAIDNPEKVQADNARIEALDQQHNLRLEKLDTQSIQQRIAVWNSLKTNINSGAQTALTGWLQGTQTLTQAFNKMFDGVLVGLANFAAQWLLKKAEMWATDAIISHFSQASSAASQVISNAAVAGSAAAAATAAIPLVGPGLAIEAGVGMQTGVMAAFLGLASFAGGTDIVPRTGLAMLHKDEAVLGNPAAQQYRQGGSSGGNSSQTIHNHFSPTLTGPDHAATARAMYPEFKRQMANEFRNANA